MKTNTPETHICSHTLYIIWHSNLLKQQRATSHLQVAKTMIILHIIYVLYEKVKTMNTPHKINCSKCKQIVFAKWCKPVITIVIFEIAFIVTV